MSFNLAEYSNIKSRVTSVVIAKNIIPTTTNKLNMLFPLKIYNYSRKEKLNSYGENINLSYLNYDWSLNR